MDNFFYGKGGFHTLDTVKKLAREYLNLKLPCTSADLKSAFRIACQRFHPDKGGVEASHDKFVAMKDAYDLINSFKGNPQVLVDESSVKENPLTTFIEGIPLSELGKGLGPTKNGKPCDLCHGRGFRQSSLPNIFNRTRHATHYKCYRCDGTGEVEVLNPVLQKGSIVSVKRQKRQKTCASR